ncbi:MAG: rhodanese-like domain-containing protein [Planctomycetota bacterium]|nr:rhodanese-like domain-containing protein [Planctomycetota bacterium]
MHSETKDSVMYLKQFYLQCLAHASYLVGDKETGKAIVIDPQRDIEVYVNEAKAEGLTIEHVFLTHFHADFAAGHLELQKATGAKISLGSKAQADYEFEALTEGQTLDYGSFHLRVLETPGHTPEGVSLVLYDHEKDGEKPYAVFTGDTLFVGDVGRPDLLASVGMTADELGAALYHSLREKLLTLPDETLVYPAHGAGSLCGKQLGKETFSDIGTQRRQNYALQDMTASEFIELVTADQAPAPQYFVHAVSFNKSQHRALTDTLAEHLKALTLDQVLEYQRAGAQVLDTRDSADFAVGHLKGAWSMSLGGKFATWAGSLLSPDQKLVLIAKPGDERESAERLGRIGYDNVLGFLGGSWEEEALAKDMLQRNSRIDVALLKNLLKIPVNTMLVDVRSKSEWALQRVAGSCNIPLPELLERLQELPRDKSIVVQCASGYRSSIAASLLAAAGYTKLSDQEGGIKAWVDAGFPTESETSSCGLPKGGSCGADL